MTAQLERLLIFVGSYAETSNPGVYVYSLDEQTEELTLLDQVSGLKNPTFLNVDADRLRLYSITEGLSEEGQKTGDAVSYAIDPVRGTLSELNRSVTVDAPTCHIQRDERNQYLVVASYHGGRVGLVSLSEDGKIGEKLDKKQHEGSSVHERQNQPHPHSAYFSPDQRYIYVPDLGIDRIRAYTIDETGKQLQFLGDTTTQPGAGPRHMVFHPNGKLAFVINELDSTLSSYRYNADTGELHPIETVPTLPDGFQGENTCAEVAVSADGRFLYGSNRGHDSIVVYQIDSETGGMSFVERVSTEGQHPRHFALMPGGRLLIAANRDTNNLAIFRIDQATGKLRYTGRSVEVSQPVCVQPAIFAVDA